MSSDSQPKPDALKTTRRVDAKLRTRFEIRSAAVELFREQGFANVTTEQIATRVGVTQRTLFRHFRSKDAILFDDDSLVEFFDAALDRHLGDHDPIQAIRLTLLDMAASYDRNAELFRAHHEVISQSSMLRAFARQRTARIDDLVALGFEGHLAFRARDRQPRLTHRVAAAVLIGAVRVITDDWLEGRIAGSMVELSRKSWPALQVAVESSLALPNSDQPPRTQPA